MTTIPINQTILQWFTISTFLLLQLLVFQLTVLNYVTWAQYKMSITLLRCYKISRIELMSTDETFISISFSFAYYTLFTSSCSLNRVSIGRWVHIIHNLLPSRALSRFLSIINSFLLIIIINSLKLRDHQNKWWIFCIYYLLKPVSPGLLADQSISVLACWQHPLTYYLMSSPLDHLPFLLLPNLHVTRNIFNLKQRRMKVPPIS